MGRTWVTALVSMFLAACGGGADDGPATRRHCIAVVAHTFAVENAFEVGGEQYARETSSKPENEEMAMQVIAIHEAGMLPPGSGDGEGERRITRCMAERTRRGAQCVVNAKTPAAIAACPK